MRCLKCEFDKVLFSFKISEMNLSTEINRLNQLVDSSIQSYGFIV